MLTGRSCWCVALLLRRPLQVWAGYRCRSSQSHLLGLLHLPSQFAWVPTLALTHLLVPQASFTAHMAGVCAGLCRAYALEPGVCVCVCWNGRQQTRLTHVGQDRHVCVWPRLHTWVVTVERVGGVRGVTCMP